MSEFQEILPGVGVQLTCSNPASYRWYVLDQDVTGGNYWREVARVAGGARDSVSDILIRITLQLLADSEE